MNRIVLTGYIASDIELKTTADGANVASARIAVKRPHVKDKTDYFQFVCWRATADFLSKYFRKGSGIEISGMLTSRQWEDQEGNKRYAIEIVADEVDFGKKSKSETEAQASEPAADRPIYNPYTTDRSEFVDIPTDDSLPF